MNTETAIPNADLEENPGGSLSPSACHLLEGLDKRWNKFCAQLEHCQQEFGEEPVHDLRVASRRLLATLAMCEIVVPRLKVKKLRRDIKSHLDSLDELRDTHVMMLFLARKFRKDEGARAFLAHLTEREKLLIQKASSQIQELNQDKIAAKMGVIRTQLVESVQGKDVARKMLTAADHAYAEVIRRRVSVNPSKVKTIHKMRIAFKKFRYMVEISARLLPTLPEKHLKTLQAYQTMMGNIQDMDVMLAEVDRFNAEHAELDMALLRDAVLGLRAARIEYFLARIGRVNRQWRANPAAKFPWERKTPAAAGQAVV